MRSINGKTAPSTFLHKLLDVTPDTSVVAFSRAKCYLYLLGLESGLHKQILVTPRRLADECGHSTAHGCGRGLL
jgi:hypothetical protein